MNTYRKSRLSRRTFLKNVGTSAAATGAAWLLAGTTQRARAKQVTENGVGILIDLTRCVGCHSCALACKERNNLPQTGSVPTALDKDTYTFVEPRRVVNRQGESQTYYVKRQCMHCLNAACVSACPAAAMYNSGQGPIIYRANRCLGCRYCQVACPFGVPRFNWENGLTPEISKCWLCYRSLQAGQAPACVSACPTGALRFGRRDELLAQAHAQIATHPDRYVNHVYGESEVGGTSMLYLSGVPFEQLGFRTDLPKTAPPEETEKIMSALPYVIAGVAALMTGSAVYTHRKPAQHGEEPPTASHSPQPEGQEE